MDFIYFSLGLVCGLAVWGVALFCHRIQPSHGERP